MTIKTKLITNVLVTAAIVVALSLASFFSMSFLQKNLFYLTEKSTPFQIRTIELQRELQATVSALLRVNTARSMAEFSTSKADAEMKLAQVFVTRQALDTAGVHSSDLSAELRSLAQELFSASHARIASSNAAAAAHTRVTGRMEQSSDRLKELDRSIRNLQANRSAAFVEALESTGIISIRLRNVETLRDLFKDLQNLAQSLLNARTGTSQLLVATGKLNTVASRIAKNGYFKNNPVFKAQCQELIDKLSEQIRVMASTQSHKDDGVKNRAVEAVKELSPKFNSLYLMLVQDTEYAGHQLEVEAGRQRDSFSQSNTANSILVENSELMAAGLRLSAGINRLFLIESASDLDQMNREIQVLFNQIQQRVQTLDKALVHLNALHELTLLHAASAALAATHTEVSGAEGILAALKTRLKVMEQADMAAGKLHAMVLRQATKGNEIVSSARGEQEKAVTAVNSMIGRSLYQIVGIGSAAIIIGIIFGFWIYRSVLLPLRVVLGAVRSQQAQGQEKAQLAEAVASGDLNRNVTISEPLTLDAAQLKKDEMGMVLSAVAGMSEAQSTLDRALADMTVSLRTGRDKELRRDHLKSGLHELNNILREEHDTATLLEYTLAFMVAFLDAGVGILYLYNERDELLLPAATYAISLAERPDAGTLRSGEGLVGQVASDHRMIHLDKVPPGYLPITSALGEADPLQVAILPVIHNGMLAGVLELGSFKPFGEDDFEFLRQGLEGIAIAINTNRSRQLVNDLLEQTQSQSEELRVQQEELQQSNEELEERARMLEDRLRSI